MLVSEVINAAKYGELNQLAIKDNTEALMSFINLGVIELYKRFKISTKVEIVRTNPAVSVYELRNTDIEEVKEIYDAHGRELTTPLDTDDEDYDVRQISLTVFMVKEPKEEELAFVYTSSPATLTSVDDEVPIPTNMLEALLHYIGYRAHGSIDGNISAENNTHYVRFDKSCQELLLKGYGEVSEMPFRNVRKKGFL